MKFHVVTAASILEKSRTKLVVALPLGFFAPALFFLLVPSRLLGFATTVALAPSSSCFIRCSPFIFLLVILRSFLLIVFLFLFALLLRLVRRRCSLDYR